MRILSICDTLPVRGKLDGSQRSISEARTGATVRAFFIVPHRKKIFLTGLKFTSGSGFGVRHPPGSGS